MSRADLITIVQALTIALAYFALGTYAAAEYFTYQCNEYEFIRIFETGYYCGERSSGIGGLIR